MRTGDIVIQDREELYFLLAEAAEFEHSVMCSYLYAMWSLKRDAAEGVSAAELQAIDGWRRSLRQVALEEMLHLSLVNNILAATGSAPHWHRPPFPVAAGWFPANVVMRLAPFSAETMDHFLYLERPEGVAMVDGAGFAHPSHHRRPARPDRLTPTPRDYESQGQLYHAILRGLISLVERVGEAEVFVGHGEAQAGRAEIGMPGLFRVNDLASATRAIEEIVAQGEGAPAHREGSHYQRFAAIDAELKALKAARPDFEPARPAAANPALDGGRRGVTRITDATSAKVVDLGDALYALMTRTFAQVFSAAPLPGPLRAGLSAAATEMMQAMSLVGEAATLLPAGPAGATAGLTFTLPGSNGGLVQRCAAQILGERTRELAGAAAGLEGASPALAGLGARLVALAGRLDDLHERFEDHLSLTVDAVAKGPPSPAPAVAAGDDPNVASTAAVTLRFDAARCIHSRRCVLSAPGVFLANVKGPWLHPETVSAERVAEIAHACPSGAITYERRDGGAQEAAPEVNVLTVRENGPYAVHAALELGGRGAMFRATLCRCGLSRNKPFCDNSHRDAGFAATGEPATIESEPLERRNGALVVTPLKDGPLEVVGALEIVSGTGRTVNRVETARLCRCGHSATKPFCDGSHVRVGFRSEEPAGVQAVARPAL